MQGLKNIYHLFQAILANFFYRWPAKKLKVIGVTGTDGKTTTTHLIYHLLKSSGKKVSMISTVEAKVADQQIDTGLHTTTPNPFQIQRLLRQAVDNGDEYFVLEITSHGLDQNRDFGINYYIGVITNITHEHLDYHKNYENYLRTKAKLLLRSKISIINKDDQSYKKLKKLLSNKKVYSYSTKQKADFIWNKKIITQLKGDFNQENILAAYSVAILVGIKEKEILAAIKSFTAPIGRLQLVYDSSFKVIVDFAHTPNAIAKALKVIKKNFLCDKGKIIHVFGSAGLRDASKRPLMGQASAKYADLVILTEEDYRTEDPYLISRQIAQGLIKAGFKEAHNWQNLIDKTFFIIIDRKKAIEKALSLAKKNDIVVCTGKAHEKSLCRGKKEYPWDEIKVIKNILAK
ncbi:MAG: UDP-N-acetylmuramyl-tripeptide synthetase [Microgenomates group bacterium]|nr:UDP-N-acetylmuramyl-tripeptide synthetase [Microgenomates group bacterium]